MEGARIMLAMINRHVLTPTCDAHDEDVHAVLAVLKDHQFPRVRSHVDLAAQVGVLADHGVRQVVQQQQLRVDPGERILAAYEHEAVWNNERHWGHSVYTIRSLSNMAYSWINPFVVVSTIIRDSI